MILSVSNLLTVAPHAFAQVSNGVTTSVGVSCDGDGSTSIQVSKTNDLVSELTNYPFPKVAKDRDPPSILANDS